MQEFTFECCIWSRTDAGLRQRIQIPRYDMVWTQKGHRIPVTLNSTQRRDGTAAGAGHTMRRSGQSVKARRDHVEVFQLVASVIRIRVPGKSVARPVGVRIGDESPLHCRAQRRAIRFVGAALSSQRPHPERIVRGRAANAAAWPPVRAAGAARAFARACPRLTRRSGFVHIRMGHALYFVPVRFDPVTGLRQACFQADFRPPSEGPPRLA